jgi:hypothetical protein
MMGPPIEVQRMRGKDVRRIAVGLVLLLAILWGVAPIPVPRVSAAGIAQESQAARIERAFMQAEVDTLQVKLDRLNSRFKEKPEDSADSLGRDCRADAERHLGQGVSGCDRGWQVILLRW